MSVFMKVIAISIFSLFVVGMGLFTTRIWGQGQVYQSFDHPFFHSTESQKLVVLKTNNLAIVKEEFSLHKNLIYWLDVSVSSDNKLIVLNSEKPQAILTQKNLGTDWRGIKIPAYTSEKLLKLFPESHLLSDYLTEFPDQRFILNILDNVQDLQITVMNEVEKYNPDQRILIQSDTLVVLSSIKEKKPMWVFGSSYPDIMRLLSMHSMWILPAAGFKGDAYISPLKISNRDVIQTEVLDEMKRRYKKVLLGPLSSEQELQTALQYKPDGVILNENLRALVETL